MNLTKEQIDDVRLVAYAYLRQGILDTALVFFEALLELDHKTPYDLSTVGAIYLEMGRPEEALPFFDLSLQKEPDNQFTQLNKIKAFSSLGKKRQALLGAIDLKKSQDPIIAKEAEALTLAYEMKEISSPK